MLNACQPVAPVGSVESKGSVSDRSNRGYCFKGKSRCQEIVEDYVRQWCPTYTILSDYRPTWMDGLELDIWMPFPGIAIEVHGEQHYYWIPSLQKTPYSFLRQKKNDSKKRKLCKQGKIRLFEVKAVVDGIRMLYAKMWRAGVCPRRILSWHESKTWQDHINVINAAYSWNPRYTFKEALALSQNRPARTRSDNQVPCNAPF